MGNKGILTRARIVAATADLMQRRALRDLRVAEIGALAGVSSAAFYLYFETVADAGLAVVEELQQATPEILKLLESEWTRETVLRKARTFVQSYFSYWDRHYALLRVRNFIADEGDKRFMDVRRRSIEPIHLALQGKIIHFQSKLPVAEQLDAASTASVILSMVERTAAVVRQPSAHKATRPRQIDAAAFMIAAALMGVLPTAEG
jgi:AcrR family transcriptional regulator